MDALVRTARTTGLFYLGLAITGMFGFLLIRPKLFVADDAASTLANLVAHSSLARVGVAFELGIVVTQALLAIWFYRLFRTIDAVAAGSIAAFGLVNAVAILGSAAMLGSAVTVAHEPVGDAAATVQLLYLISGNLWTAGNLFFGLWLVPMGLCVLRSRWMPRPLGWVLVAGGVGYVLAGFATYLFPGVPAIAEVLTVPATVGEFWMIGYLLIRGVRRTATASPEALPAT
ncbi:DUF4386 domain-containing protein [Luedemannella flava]|uniref:DUF4386 domain-containing protein n=1 Tax=Luedemannella flava TaxID=349316 RepID=A0ABN2MF35_9ACTN